MSNYLAVAVTDKNKLYLKISIFNNIRSFNHSQKPLALTNAACK